MNALRASRTTAKAEDSEVEEMVSNRLVSAAERLEQLAKGYHDSNQS